MYATWKIVLTIVLLSGVLQLVGTTPIAGAATDGSAVTSTSQARDVALRDPSVQSRLALRPGKYDVEVDRIELEAGLDALGMPSGERYRVRWTQDGVWRLEAYVDPESSDVQNVSGQAHVIMPGEENELSSKLKAPLWNWGFLVVFLLVLLTGPRTRFWHTLGALPLAIIAIGSCVMLANLLTVETIRWGSIVLFGAMTLTLVGAAVGWVRHARRGASAGAGAGAGARLPIVASIVIMLASVGAQIAFVNPPAGLADVAYASSAGAELLRVGVTPYGNILDIPGFVFEGDTYGPISYLAYLPASMAAGGVAVPVLTTNIMLGVVTALLLFLTIRRRAGARTGAWAAAVWLSCPFVLSGIVDGHNDIVTAALIGAVVGVARWPWIRGVAFAAVVATKFLPALLFAAFLRRRGETRMDGGRALLAFALASIVIWGYAIRDAAGLEAFIDIIVFQDGRDDIASIWGLLGIGSVRYVLLAAAVAVAIWSQVRASRIGFHATLLAGTAAIALAFAGLPQFWPSYVGWLVPLLLVVATVPDEDAPIVIEGVDELAVVAGPDAAVAVPS